MKISDEVIVKMWNAFERRSDFPDFKTGMRAAAEVLVPVVLEEALDLAQSVPPYEPELDAVIAAWNWDEVPNLIDHQRIKQMMRDAVCIWTANRLARLTAKPDPRREAIRSALDEIGLHPNFIDSPEVQKAIDKIVAAVEGKQVTNG